MPDDRTSSTHLQIEAEGQTPETETLKQLRQLAEGGDPAAQNNLGWMYQNGRDVSRKMMKKAIKWYRKAAQQGYAIAQDNLGWMYQHDRGVPQSDAEAVKWFRKAAEGWQSRKSPR